MTPEKIKQLQENCNRFKQEAEDLRNLMKEMTESMQNQMTTFNWEVAKDQMGQPCIIRSTNIVDQLNQSSLSRFHIGRIEFETNTIVWYALNEQVAVDKESE